MVDPNIQGHLKLKQKPLQQHMLPFVQVLQCQEHSLFQIAQPFPLHRDLRHSVLATRTRTSARHAHWGTVGAMLGPLQFTTLSYSAAECLPPDLFEASFPAPSRREQTSLETIIAFPHGAAGCCPPSFTPVPSLRSVSQGPWS